MYNDFTDYRQIVLEQVGDQGDRQKALSSFRLASRYCNKVPSYQPVMGMTRPDFIAFRIRDFASRRHDG